MNINLLNAVNAAEIEQSALAKLQALLDEWRGLLTRCAVWDEGTQKHWPANECFCADGFYPCYYSQSPKILFIAREAVGMWGEDYIETLLKAFRENLVAGVPVNRHAFHSRMMYIAYGAIQGNCEKPYGDLPWAGDIAQTFGTPEGISFAFMELSKYSNEREDANAHCDTELMKQFLEDSCLDTTRFIQREMEILDPDIIITMNLWECGIDAALIEKALGHVSQICGNSYLPHATLNVVRIGERQVPLIDMAHFSSRKSHKVAFYAPAMKIMRDLKARGMLQ